MIQDACVDLFYITSNRLEFTRETFTALLCNTDWRFVRELVLNDNNSVDGTCEWIEQAAKKCPAPVKFIKADYTSAVTAMLNFIESAQSPILAKVDNDAMMPPGWLRQCLQVMERHPQLMLLGTEAFNPAATGPDVVFSYTPSEFISGLGLYRKQAFARSRPVPFGKYWGLEEWQMAQGPAFVRGWINPAINVFLLDRLPFEPWLSYSKNYLARGWQRESYFYQPASALWKWRWPGEDKSPMLEDQAAVTYITDVESRGDPRFLCVMRIKNEAAHIREVLERALHLCRRALVLDDHSTDDTASICESFGTAVTIIRSPFAGLDEARDKNFLLQKIAQENPEFVFWIDGDEVLEADGPQQIRAAVELSPQAAVWYLRIAYLWDHALQVRVDGIFGNFRRPSLFRFQGQPRAQLEFRPTGCGSNLHCSNVPNGVTGEHRDLPVRLKHYGYLTPQQRLAKYNFYTRVDPNNELEDNYRHLIDIPGARHAPGPMQLIPWVEAVPARKVTSRREPLSETAASTWLQLLKKTLVRYPLDASELAINGELQSLEPALRADIERWIQHNHSRQLQESGDLAARALGRDWPATAETMMGLARMDHLHNCLLDVLRRDVPGDFVEIGVWRGGAGIMMRAALQAMNDTRRKVWLADSFQGYPHPDPAQYPADQGDPHRTFSELAVPLERVKRNFERYGLNDDQLSYLSGWYRDTLPAAPIQRISLLHLDCDMYESYMIALRNLYPKVSPGGYVIIDDYGAIPACRQAVMDFRRQFAITEELRSIDWTGVYWQIP